MPIPVAVPRLGTRMRGGLVAEWYHADGARVQHGDPVCRLECDFVAVDLEADGDGVLRHRMDAGLIRPPGDLLGVILASGERMPEFEPVDLDAFLPEPVESRTEPVRDDASLQPSPAANVPEPGFEAEIEAEAKRAGEATTVGNFESEPAPPTVDLAETVEARMDEAQETDSAASSPAIAPAPMLFARRFGSFQIEDSRTESWDLVPGDSADFVSGLFPVPRDTTLESHVEPATPADDEPESSELAAWLESDPENQPAPAPEQPAHENWRDWEASLVEQVADAGATPVTTLTMRCEVNLAETTKMCASLTSEWRSAGIRPTTEDVVVRAVARAFRDLPLVQTGSIALRTLDADGDATRVLANAATRMFKDAISVLGFEPDEDAGDSQCTITSVGALGIDEATPPLASGQPVALALGAERCVPRWDGERFLPVLVAMVSMSYDPTLIGDGAAARFLARVRTLIESPYALLADA